MNTSIPQSLFFVDLPDLKKLCAVKIILNLGIRDTQIKLCRYLLLLHDDILAAPEPEDFTLLSIVMRVSLYKTGKLQALVEKQGAKMNAPERVTPAMFQTCLSYTLIARLAPRWNKAGHLLIQGEDFLTKSGKQNAVAMHINVSDTHICISLEVYTIRLPPCELTDFNIATGTLQRFLNEKNAVMQRHSISSNWCYILPSMKMGQIISISHDIPPESPFKSYKDFQTHWNMLYGYQLPEMASEDIIYCNIYFKLIGDKLFSYPFFCVRSEPFQFFPRVDLDTVLNDIIFDMKSQLTFLCGFPVTMTNKPLYPIKVLTKPQSQDSQPNLVNLTSDFLPNSLVQSSQSVENFAIYSTETSQQVENAAHQPKENVSENLNLTLNTHPAQVYIKSASSATLLFRSQSYCSSVNLIEKVDHIIPVFQKKVQGNHPNYIRTGIENRRETLLQNTSLAFQQKPYTVFTPHTTQANETFGAISENMTKKQCEQIISISSGAKPYRPSFSLKPKSSALIANDLVNRAEINKKETLSKKIHPSCLPSASKELASVCPMSQKVLKPNSIIAEVHAPNITADQASNFKWSTVYQSNKIKKQCNISKIMKNMHKLPPANAGWFANAVHTDSSKEEETLEVRTKKSRTKPVIQDVDIETHAKNNQLFKLNNVTLQNWLKQHGISTKTRDKKEELIAKIMQFLEE